MANGKVSVVDAGKIREFTKRCATYQSALADLERRLNRSVQTVSQSWRDPDFTRLLQSVDAVRVQVGQARKTVDGCLMPFLAQKLKVIGEKGGLA